MAVACHQEAESEEKNVAAKLLETGMAVLVPESSRPRPSAEDGRLLTGELFGVSSNSSEGSFNCDQRPNSIMPRLDWAC